MLFLQGVFCLRHQKICGKALVKCGSKLVFTIRNNFRHSINKIGNRFNSLDPRNEFNKIGIASLALHGIPFRKAIFGSHVIQQFWCSRLGIPLLWSTLDLLTEILQEQMLGRFRSLWTKASVFNSEFLSTFFISHPPKNSKTKKRSNFDWRLAGFPYVFLFLRVLAAKARFPKLIGPLIFVGRSYGSVEDLLKARWVSGVEMGTQEKWVEKVVFGGTCLLKKHGLINFYPIGMNISLACCKPEAWEGFCAKKINLYTNAFGICLLVRFFSGFFHFICLLKMSWCVYLLIGQPSDLRSATIGRVGNSGGFFGMYWMSINLESKNLGAFFFEARNRHQGQYLIV